MRAVLENGKRIEERICYMSCLENYSNRTAYDNNTMVREGKVPWNNIKHRRPSQKLEIYANGVAGGDQKFENPTESVEGCS